MAVFNNIVNMLGASSIKGFNANQDTAALIFEPSASPSMTLTPPEGNTRKMTIFFGIKRAKISDSDIQTILAANTTEDLIGFDTDDVLRVWFGTNTYNIETQAKHVDPTGVIHGIIAIDTEQVTDSDRVVITLNGVEVSDFDSATYPPQNHDTALGDAVSHAIGKATGNYNYLASILSYIGMVNGQQLSAGDLGFFDSRGVWQYRKYVGDYGPSGWLLDFSDNSTVSALGTDTRPLVGAQTANDWTVNNFTVDDVVKDTWSNNFATWNPLSRRRTISTLPTFSNGNLQVAFPNAGGNATYAISTHGVDFEKYYYEIEVITRTTEIVIGLGNGAVIDDNLGVLGYQATNGVINGFASNDGPGASYTSGDVIGVAIDYIGGTCDFYKNGVLQATGTGISINDPKPFVQGNTGDTILANFGQKPFIHTPPGGFKPLNTANLPTPIIPDGSKHSQVITWTGDGTDDRLIPTTEEFDLIWIKNRNDASNNTIHDRVRGNDKPLSSNGIGLEGTNTGYFSFVEGGFEVSYSGSAGTSTRWNNSGHRYVAWCWKMGGNSVENTDGTITTNISSNQLAGMSIVKYTGTGIFGETIGHGIGKRPDLAIFFNLSLGTDRPVWTSSISMSDFQGLELNTTDALSTYANERFDVSEINETTFGLGDYITNESTRDVLALFFAEVEGFSKFGSYIGNGSSDGPFVNCGFTPRYILIKRTDSGSNDWIIFDTVRNTYNNVNLQLRANLSSSEDTAVSVATVTANGFKPIVTNSQINASGGTYIYAAFAEYPFGGKGIAPAPAF